MDNATATVSFMISSTTRGVTMSVMSVTRFLEIPSGGRSVHRNDRACAQHAPAVAAQANHPGQKLPRCHQANVGVFSALETSGHDVGTMSHLPSGQTIGNGGQVASARRAPARIRPGCRQSVAKTPTRRGLVAMASAAPGQSGNWPSCEPALPRIGSKPRGRWPAISAGPLCSPAPRYELFSTPTGS